MTHDLVRWVEERIDADDSLDTEVGLLVLAALEGDDELDEYVASGSVPPRLRRDAHDEQPVDPAEGAFLRSVQVTGFRGIGTRVDLDLTPAPGLTVVAGRNGSGKSSLAEALEIVLTGGTYRWKNKRSTQWAEAWKNLHHAGDPEIVVEMAEQGSGPLTLRTTWPAQATDVGLADTTVQRTVDGTKAPTQDVSVLGWAPALETYRPMLSYDELGGILEAGPSELYDALAKVLGTQKLADAMARLKARSSGLAASQKAVTAERRALQAQAADLDDERAQAVAALLKKTTPDVASVRELATGVMLPDSGIVAALRALSQLGCPDPAVVSNAARRLRIAVSGMAAAGAAEAARRVSRLDIRRRAVQLHEAHGEQSCPVCTSGTLDQSWLTSSLELIAREEAELRELSDAQAELESARRGLRTLVERMPAALDRAPTDDLEPMVTAAREAWRGFEEAPPEDLALADHLELHAEELATCVGRLRGAATTALADRDDAWGPLAARIATWCGSWEAWLEAKPSYERLDAAEKWLRTNDTRLKNELIEPISDAAKHAWSVLRQESNVELGDLKLEGSATRRRVAITAKVDGQEASGALPVMSQGELHALALALFLPRATLVDSPFRFVILDDPVQAMDPAKVDGLVALLSEIAKTHQVVVFSHDDRLPAALRRSSSAARILEVTRGPGSAVSIAAAEDPAVRYLADAAALVRDEALPEETLRRTLPGLLRMAAESAARDRFFTTRLTRGEALADVEADWNAATKTAHRVSLAVYDEIKTLDGWLRTESRKKGLGVAATGFHESLAAHMDPDDAVYHARRMVDDIRAGTR